MGVDIEVIIEIGVGPIIIASLKRQRWKKIGKLETTMVCKRVLTVTLLIAQTQVTLLPFE